jgi:Zn-dependent protease
MLEITIIQKVVAWTLPVLFAITVHETAHGWMALQLGDKTAMMLGRLTLNPIRHIDPLGTILIPGLMYMMAGFMFGWAKPVPVTWQNLKQPKRDMVLVAAAGPAANLLRYGAGAGVYGRCRHLHQYRPDGAEPVAAAAAGRRPGHDRPVARAAGLQVQPYRALRVLHTGRVAGHGTAGRDPVAGDR